MSIEPNATHDPELRSWVASANDPHCDFPIQNLPFGAFCRGDEESERIGVAIGDAIVDVFASRDAGAFDDDEIAGEAARACAGPTLNPLMAMDPRFPSALRRALSGLLREGAEGRDRLALLPMAEAELTMPVDIGDYTDFYCSIDHATNVGKMLRPDNPLMPNYTWLPVGYHGRASSVVLSGRPFRRPKGQVKPADGPPVFVATGSLDYELELGFFVGPSNELGGPVGLDESEDRLFGVCLLNDWSARDVQAWEYQPLGPFLAKSFQTSISPWIVTAEALAPFRVPARPRGAGEPEPLPHLDSPRNRMTGGLDLHLEVYLTTEKMRAGGQPPHRLSRSNGRDLFWTAAQMLAHHSSNGCNLRAGDLLGSGTVSGPEKENRGCLLELTWRGAEPLTLPNGETRKFLLDGDEVILRGHAERPGARRIGFGECRGLVLPALLCP
jgi:fumarylacetoacetase